MGGYESSETTEAAVVADLAVKASGIVKETADVVILGSGQVIDLEGYGFTPTRAKGTARPKSVDAFIAYVRRHLTPATTIWAEPLDGKIVAVLNDHGPEQSGEFADLRADLALPVTPEWEHWSARDRQFGAQRDFAEHIEDGLPEIREPDGATMLEVAQTMQATVNAEFKSASRLHDGTISVGWTEHVDARAGSAGDLTIPQEMVLGIAPFYGEAPYEVRARIRYRIASGELKIGYVLDRPDVVIRDCLAHIAARLEEAFPGIVYAGTPAPPQEVGRRR